MKAGESTRRDWQISLVASLLCHAGFAVWLVILATHSVPRSDARPIPVTVFAEVSLPSAEPAAAPSAAPVAAPAPVPKPKRAAPPKVAPVAALAPAVESAPAVEASDPSGVTAAAAPPSDSSSGVPGAPGGPAVLARPSYARNPAPEYPAAARWHRQEGLVLLRVEVTAQGRAARVELARSSGVPALDESAIRAVRDWEFEPARAGAIAIDCEIEVPVRFRLAS